MNNSRIGSLCKIAAWVVILAVLLRHILLSSGYSGGFSVPLQSGGSREAVLTASRWTVLAGIGLGLFLFWAGFHLKNKEALRVPPMGNYEPKDWVWTQSVATHKDGVWRTIIYNDVLNNGQFRKARFVLADGPTIVVPSGALRDVIALTADRNRDDYVLSINPAERSINGEKVDFTVES
jgi:hypothetical protein